MVDEYQFYEARAHGADVDVYLLLQRSAKINLKITTYYRKS